MKTMNNKISHIFWITCFLWLLNCCFFGREVQAGKNRYRNFSLSFGAGCYLPHDSRFQKVYPEDEEILGFVELSKMWPIRIETTLGLGGLYFKGHPLNEDGSSNIDKASLTLAPSYFHISYLFRYNRDQKVVPYVGAGLDAWGYREKTEKETIEGCKYGHHYIAGFRFLLDWLDPKAAVESHKELGIENTYLVLEARYNKVDNFGGDKLDLSGLIYLMGFLIEF